jgi:hypothetical protein
MSGRVQFPVVQLWVLSEHICIALHGDEPAMHPRALALGDAGAQRSAPLQ